MKYADNLPRLAPAVAELAPLITREGGEYILWCRARFPWSRDAVFRFFSDARNLEQITPPWLQFKVLTEDPIQMQVGALIDYRLKIRGVPLKWRTVITQWQPPKKFEDSQLRGPYRQWIHEHAFIDEGGSTLMQDKIRYKVLGGAPVHWLLVKRDLLRIFRYRSHVLGEMFPKS
tara:strand:+ start:102 stop:623 length:522 start_codon:yes stop_codon:yes gene_type:complete